MKSQMVLAAACAALVGWTAAGDAVRIDADRAEVVIAADAPKTVRFAADEMTNLLSRTFGKAVPVAHAPTAGKTSLVLGMNEWAAAAGLSTNDLTRDAFTIAAKDGLVYILGRDDASVDPARVLDYGGWGSILFERATMFGVYEFLERYAGVRFYFPGELGTIVPRKDAVEVSGTETVKPDFMSRFLQIWDGEYFEPDPRNRAKTLSYFRQRFETMRIPACHGSISMSLVNRFGKTHPEYFALMPNGERCTTDGRMSGAPGCQLCWTSRVVDEMFEDVKSYVKGEPPTVRGMLLRGSKDKFGWNGNMKYRKYADLMPQDSFTPCACPRCQAAYAEGRAKYGDANFATPVIWGVVSNIASRLTADGVDGVISMMAYEPYGKVPDFALPPNVAVMTAVQGPWSMNNPRLLTKQNEKVSSWAKKLGHKVWLWNYPCKLLGLDVTGKGVAQNCPRAWIAYYRQIAPYADGGFAESDTDRWFFNYLNYYAFSRVCWRNDVDADALLEEHYRLMFGPAAKEMAEIYETLEECWMKGMVGNTVETKVGPVVKKPSDAQQWERIYSPAKIARFRELVAASLAKVPPDSLEARRIALVKREFVDSLAERSKAYEARAAVLRKLRLDLRVGDSRTISLVPFNEPAYPATEFVRTDVTVTRLVDALKVRYDCEEPRMADRGTVDRAVDDGDIWKDDVVELVFDPAGDNMAYCQIFVSSAGSFSDQRESAVFPGSDEGFAWNSGATAKVERGEKGWTAEITLPLSNFAKGIREFPVEFARERNVKGPRCQRLYHWSPSAFGFSDLPNLGKLVLVD